MRYYPIHLDISGKKVIVIGGGSVAYQKITGLVEAGAQVSVISPRFSQSVTQLAQEGKIQIIEREYQSGDLEGAFLAFGATNNPEVNRLIHVEAQEKGILFNAVDQPSECDFIVPSRISRGELLITISTGGQVPFLSKAIRQKLEPLFGPEYEEYVALVGKLRNHLKKLGKKDELAPFLEKHGDELLEALRRKDEVSVKRILNT
jgi:precorrin-2 dehydrogenase/sirohydrochlorin ferrochelatase